MRRGISYFAAIAVIAALGGCAPVQVRPQLNSSLGLSAFEAMGKINRRPISVAIYLPKKLTDLTFNATIKNGKFAFPVGQALSVKLIKAVSYQFQVVYVAHSLSEARAEPVKAILTVTPGEVSANFGVEAGFTTVGAKGSVRLPVRAELTDVKTGRVIWVGTSQAQESSNYREAGQMGYQEAGVGFAAAVDGVIDRTVGNLLHQLEESPNLATYGRTS